MKNMAHGEHYILLYMKACLTSKKKKTEERSLLYFAIIEDVHLEISIINHNAPSFFSTS